MLAMHRDTMVLGSSNHVWLNSCCADLQGSVGDAGHMWGFSCFDLPEGEIPELASGPADATRQSNLRSQAPLLCARTKGAAAGGHGAPRGKRDSHSSLPLAFCQAAAAVVSVVDPSLLSGSAKQLRACNQHWAWPCVWQPQAAAGMALANTPQGCPGRPPSAPYESSHAAATHRRWGAPVGPWSGRPALHGVHAPLTSKPRQRQRNSCHQASSCCSKQPGKSQNRACNLPRAHHAAPLRSSWLVSRRQAPATAVACMGAIRSMHSQH